MHVAREYCFCERDSHAFSGKKKCPSKAKAKGGGGQWIEILGERVAEEASVGRSAGESVIKMPGRTKVCSGNVQNVKMCGNYTCARHTHTERERKR